MKHVILILDGATGSASEELDGQTALQAAKLPTLDALAADGRLGTARVVSARRRVSESDWHLSLLGYDPRRYGMGEGVLTAKSRGLSYNPDEVVFCCSLVTAHEGLLQDASANLVGEAEAERLYSELDELFSEDGFSFTACKGARGLCKWKTSACPAPIGSIEPEAALNLVFAKEFARKKEHQAVVRMLQRAEDFLAKHEINLVRQDLGENSANSLWLWGDAPLCLLPSFNEIHGIQCCLLEQSDVARGIGKLAGLENCGFPEVDLSGASPYAALGDITADAIGSYDAIYAHVVLPAQVTDSGSMDAKVGVLEAIDRDFVRPIVERLKQEEHWRTLITSGRADWQDADSDARGQIMFVLNGDEVESHRGESFDEANALQGEMRSHRAHELLEYVLRT